MASAFLEFNVQGFPQVSSGQLAPVLLLKEPGMESLGPAESLGAAQGLTNMPAAARQGAGGGKDGSGCSFGSGLREQTTPLPVLSERRGQAEGNGKKDALCLPGGHSPAQKLTA